MRFQHADLGLQLSDIRHLHSAMARWDSVPTSLLCALLTLLQVTST